MRVRGEEERERGEEGMKHEGEIGGIDLYIGDEATTEIYTE